MKRGMGIRFLLVPSSRTMGSFYYYFSGFPRLLVERLKYSI